MALALKNAQRFADDAILLYQAGRHSSALIFATAALEEICRLDMLAEAFELVVKEKTVPDNHFASWLEHIDKIAGGQRFAPGPLGKTFEKLLDSADVKTSEDVLRLIDSQDFSKRRALDAQDSRVRAQYLDWDEEATTWIDPTTTERHEVFGTLLETLRALARVSILIGGNSTNRAILNDVASFDWSIVDRYTPLIGKPAPIREAAYLRMMHGR